MTEPFKTDDHVCWDAEAGRMSGTIVATRTGNFPYKDHMRRVTEAGPRYEVKSDHIAAHEGALERMDSRWRRAPCKPR